MCIRDQGTGMRSNAHVLTPAFPLRYRRILSLYCSHLSLYCSHLSIRPSHLPVCRCDGLIERCEQYSERCEQYSERILRYRRGNAGVKTCAFDLIPVPWGQFSLGLAKHGSSLACGKELRSYLLRPLRPFLTLEVDTLPSSGSQGR